MTDEADSYNPVGFWKLPILTIMTKYSLPGFAELNLDELEEYYDSQVDFKNRKVIVDLNFDEYSINPKKLDVVGSIINNLDLYNTKALDAIEQEYHSGGDTVKFYLEQHSALIDKEEVALLAFYLKRVGFYPENESYFAVFDYTLNEEQTQYLIVVTFNENGAIELLTMES